MYMRYQYHNPIQELLNHVLFTSTEQFCGNTIIKQQNFYVSMQLNTTKNNDKCENK